MPVPISVASKTAAEASKQGDDENYYKYQAKRHFYPPKVSCAPHLTGVCGPMRLGSSRFGKTLRHATIRAWAQMEWSASTFDRKGTQWR
jgi:hypothetical protein